MTSQATKDWKTILAANIRAARIEKKWTQRELAARVNDVDTLAVSRWERGKSIPQAENLTALVAVFGKDMNWFYTDHEKTVVA